MNPRVLWVSLVVPPEQSIEQLESKSLRKRLDVVGKAIEAIERQRRFLALSDFPPVPPMGIDQIWLKS
jgi:hypothetical protein